MGGLHELLNEDKITLADAKRLFEHEDFSVGNLVSSQRSFQSIENIDAVLTKILGRRYLEYVESHIFTPEGTDIPFFGNEETSLISKFPDWRSRLEVFLRARHEYVHQISMEPGLNYEDIQTVIVILAYIVHVNDEKFDLLKYHSTAYPDNGG